jgi:hypothetical protein
MDGGSLGHTLIVPRLAELFDRNMGALKRLAWDDPAKAHLPFDHPAALGNPRRERFCAIGFEFSDAS